MNEIFWIYTDYNNEQTDYKIEDLQNSNDPDN